MTILEQIQKAFEHKWLHFSKVTFQDENKIVFGLKGGKNKHTPMKFTYIKDYEGEDYFCIEWEGIETFKEPFLTLINNAFQKLSEIQGLNVTFENIHEPVFTKEQEKILDQIIDEAETKVEE